MTETGNLAVKTDKNGQSGNKPPVAGKLHFIYQQVYKTMNNPRGFYTATLPVSVKKGWLALASNSEIKAECKTALLSMCRATFSIHRSCRFNKDDEVDVLALPAVYALAKTNKFGIQALLMTCTNYPLKLPLLPASRQK
ncbi:hypothetical protein KPC83_05010 [Collinsella sp. zg1085]|uniref:hypothetical protein n=1 Tax=Collinsella sp. zg1085 TaxID=2844380 RepID=UPI001C0DED73|nr:hypothetical protein [Collinsella sp. zg1085]QWT17204.1 hypothetical protein KPC83_05010 [Collinsella sp. zg1085]